MAKDAQFTWSIPATWQRWFSRADGSANMEKVEVVRTAKPKGRLQRSMKVLGTLLITLSTSSPASSVFTVVPGLLLVCGSGAFLSMALAALVGLFMAFVYAELSSAYPLAGGEYAIAARVLGPLPGFIVLGVYLVVSLLIPAVMALAIATYLGVLSPTLPTIPTRF